MKRKSTPIGLVIITTVFLFSSCKKEDKTVASSTSQLSFAINTDNSTSTVVNTSPVTGGIVLSNANVTITSGIANIASFKLEAKKNNVKTEITTKNLVNADLFALAGQAVVSTSIDTGTYKEIEIRATLAKTTTTSLPLVLKGYFTTKAGTQVPLEFDYNDNAVLSAEADNVHIDGTKDLGTTFNLHLNKLLANITAADVDQTTRTNNTILISSSVNTALYNKILANLPSSTGSKGFELHAKSGK